MKPWLKDWKETVSAPGKIFKLVMTQILCVTLSLSLSTSSKITRQQILWTRDSSWTTEIGESSSQGRGVVASQKGICNYSKASQLRGWAVLWSGPRFTKYELRAKLAPLSDGAIRALTLSCQGQPEDRLSELLEKIQSVDTLIGGSRGSYLKKVVAWLVSGSCHCRGQSFSVTIMRISSCDYDITLVFDGQVILMVRSCCYLTDTLTRCAAQQLAAQNREGERFCLPQPHHWCIVYWNMYMTILYIHLSFSVLTYLPQSLLMRYTKLKSRAHCDVSELPLIA